MKRSRFRLLLALSLAALMSASGTVAGLWSLARKDLAQSALDQAIASRQKIGARLQSAQDEKAGLKRAQLRIDALGKRGLVGAGLRAEWAENLAKARRELNLAEFDSEFAAPSPSGEPGPSLCASSLMIKTRLRHEGEFLRLIAALQAGAIVLPRHCALERLAGDSPGITAECTLDRLTLSLPPAKTSSRIAREDAEGSGAKARQSRGSGPS